MRTWLGQVRDMPSLLGARLTVATAKRDREIGWAWGFDIKSLDECAATHVVAAFDPRLDGTCSLV